MTKNIAAALSAVFIFAAIPTPASAFGVGGGSGGEGGLIYNYWIDLEARLAVSRLRMRRIEDSYPDVVERVYKLDDAAEPDKLTRFQKMYLESWKESRRIISIFSSRASGSRN
ncbi:MAG: hypothetical protein JJ911_10565 [Rhizobiaceae bacterium]|nr:hypothetical protein [Rhizobiaceae bacterium]